MKCQNTQKRKEKKDAVFVCVKNNIQKVFVKTNVRDEESEEI